MPSKLNSRALMCFLPAWDRAALGTSLRRRAQIVSAARTIVRTHRSRFSIPQDTEGEANTAAQADAPVRYGHAQGSRSRALDRAGGVVSDLKPGKGEQHARSAAGRVWVFGLLVDLRKEAIRR